jgi:hypothetical protein
MRYRSIANASIFYLVGYNGHSILWFSSKLSVYIMSHHTGVCGLHGKYILLSLVETVLVTQKIRHSQ